jgi:hypothetical protein
VVAELATEESRHKVELAGQRRLARQLRTLRRARRVQHKAERRMLEARRRAAELRGMLESVDY